jgi:CvfB-like winged helix domain
MVEIISFGPMGASVNVIGIGHNVPDDQLVPVDEPPLAKGLILQREIHLFRLARNNVDVTRGEVLSAYVERIRETASATDAAGTGTGVSSIPKLDICLRAFGAIAKANEASALILQRLNDLSVDGVAELPIGDRSPHEDIGRYFPGMSKTAFKRAVGNLFDQKKVWPSPHAIRLYTADDAAKAAAGRGRKKI